MHTPSHHTAPRRERPRGREGEGTRRPRALVRRDEFGPEEADRLLSLHLYQALELEETEGNFRLRDVLLWRALGNQAL